MKKVILVLALGLMFINYQMQAQDKTENKLYAYTGVNWDKYEAHTIEISVLDTVIASTIKMVQDIPIKNGKFVITGTLASPQNAYFTIYNKKGDYVYSTQFVLEPGELNFNLNTKTSKIKITGGTYNVLFNPILQNPEYLAKEKEFIDFKRSKPDYNEKAASDKFHKLSAEVRNFNIEKFNDIRFYHKDPYARLLAINYSDRSIDCENELDELEKELGTVSEIITLCGAIRIAKSMSGGSGSIAISDDIKDFTASDLNGAAFHLADVLKENKYVLVEFWASWCGPCRAEIPHMKKAYQKHKNNGFEIVSFTLDHKRDRWENASKEEELPWVNVGDLLAYKSPIVKMYGIRSIPANFLVDASGKIIARDLHQEQLDRKLEELLN